MAAPRVQHFVETRFSIRLGSDGAELDRDWLAQRVRLLRRYCLPSVAAQAAGAFEWLLLCDAATPPDVLAVLRRHERDLPALHVTMTGPARPPLAVVRALVTADTDVVITTRLDSDDAVADGYLAAVREYAQSFHRSGLDSLLVNFPRGLRIDDRTGSVFGARMPNSPFHSLFERSGRGPVDTVFRPAADDRPNHAFLHECQVTLQDESMVAWLQVVHGRNIKNDIDPAAARSPDAALAAFTLGHDANAGG